MTSLGEFANAKLLECDLLKANQIEGNIIINDISTNTLSFNEKWKFLLDTNDDLLLKNEMLDVVSLSGSALTGHISILGGGGGGGATDLSDLNDVTTPNPSDITTNGSIMYYNQSTNTYSFTNEFAYALSTWNVRLPFSFTDIDLQILQGANDLSKNIRIGGAKRTASIANGRSIAIGEEAGQILQKNNCIAIGYKSGQSLQGNNIFTTGDSIAIGTEAGENNQEDSSISIGKAAGKTNQKSSSIAIGNNAGSSGQNVGSLAIGFNTAKTNQGVNAIAIGFNSGLSSQAGYSTFIGTSAGNTGSNSYAVGIGYLTSSINCGTDSIGIGREALFSGGGENAIAIGKEAGKSNFPDNSIGIGTESGFTNGGRNCIYIGEKAGLNGSNHDNVIVLNASSSQNNPAGSDRCYIKPLRATQGTSLVQYDNTSGEVTYNNTIGGVNITGQITLTGNSGVSGEILTSQGASAPIWAVPSPSTSIFAGIQCNNTKYWINRQSITFTTQVQQGITATSAGFTATSNGWYNLTYNFATISQFQWAYSYIYIMKNGSSYFNSEFRDGGSPWEHDAPHGGGMLIQLNNGDTITFDVEVDVGNYWNVNGFASLIKM
ncbi:MAG: hypothetical protein GY932_14000, partial [Arcobacter sp.]|nr:hypothetical protein [Arcobacter sp.]